MKKLLFVLAVIMLVISCRKNIESIKPVQPTTPQLSKPDYLELPTGAQKRTVQTNGPQSKNLYFFDFDGGVVSGTSWNFNGDIIYGPSGLTTTEQQQVMARWVQAYDTLNVSLTTDEAKFNRANVGNKQKIIVTVSWEWYGQSGGVSFINSFGTGNPSWVFSSLLNYNVHNIGEAACHEAGHTLNLYHQCVFDSACNKTAEYRPGVIMGVSYYVPAGVWTVGPNSYGCTSIQHDLTVMSGIVGYK